VRTQVQGLVGTLGRATAAGNKDAAGPGQRRAMETTHLTPQKRLVQM